MARLNIKSAESIKTTKSFQVSTNESPVSLVNLSRPWQSEFAMTFNTRGADDPVMWITYDGKIHVKPDAPADETAREVFRILQEFAIQFKV